MLTNEVMREMLRYLAPKEHETGLIIWKDCLDENRMTPDILTLAEAVNNIKRIKGDIKIDIQNIMELMKKEKIQPNRTFVNHLI
eukprot:UN24316